MRVNRFGKSVTELAKESAKLGKLKKFTLRIYESDKEKMEQLAYENKVSESELIRALIRSQKLTNNRELIDLKREENFLLRKLGNNVNQIAKGINTLLKSDFYKHEQIEELEQLFQGFKDFVDVIAQRMEEE